VKSLKKLPDTSINMILRIYERLLESFGPQGWWPVRHGLMPPGWEIMAGAVLTQNAAWTNVEKAIENLRLDGALEAERLLALRSGRLASLIRPAGYFNVKARRLRAMCRWLIGRGGIRKIARLPTQDLRKALLAVHGIGPETADDILLYAFHRPVFVIDAYTRRIFQRLGVIDGNEDYETLRRVFETTLDSDAQLFNEYHALIVVHGKDICRKRPLCENCCLAERCPSSNSLAGRRD